MKYTIKSLGLALVMMAASAAHAIPTLDFDGTFSVDSNTGIVSVVSTISYADDITAVSSSDLIGSSLNFSALFEGFDSFWGLPVAYFGTTAGTDITLAGSVGSPPLLSGNFNYLDTIFIPFLDFGLAFGEFNANGGILQNDFAIADLFAIFEFDSQSQSGITGSLSGTITGRHVIASVPAPGMLLLLASGVLLMGFVSRVRAQRSL